MERQSLPARPSLEQLRKQAKELVKNHRAQDAATLALIRACLPALAGKTDEEIVLFPFALHDAQSVIARQYGFPGWNQLRNHIEALSPHRLTPDASIEEKFKIVCRAREQGDYALFCSVMNETMRTAITPERFASGNSKVAAYFQPGHAAVYMGEMIQGEHVIHFWRMSAPGQNSDLMLRMGIKDDLVSGLLFSPPWDTAIGKNREKTKPEEGKPD